MSSSTITNPYITENWLHMKKNHEYIKVEAKQELLKSNSESNEDRKKVLQRRKSSVAAKKPEARKSVVKEPGLVKLADSFRDTLANGRKQELAKIGFSQRKSLSVITSPPPKHLADPIHHAKRRTSLAASPQPKAEVKRRTSVLNPQLKNVTDTISQAKRRASTTNTSIKTVVEKRRASTLASPQPKQPTETNDIKRKSNLTKEIQQPRRRTLSSGSLLQERNKLTPTHLKATMEDSQRRHSLAATVHRTSPRKSIKSGEEEDAIRRKSILAAATLKARQLDPEGDLEEKKRSEGTDGLLARRMSRTENLKDGLPTSRRKSIKPEETEKTVIRTVRKRGKTLPGNLAKPPPPVQALQLPPMKVGPIQLNLPKPIKRNSLLAKSPLIKATNTRPTNSNKTTPIPTSSSSSSPTSGEIIPRKTQSKAKITQGRRASVKVTPPLKPPPISASPRVRPRSSRRPSTAETKVDTRRKSLAETTKKTVETKYDPTVRRKSAVERYEPTLRRKSAGEQGGSHKILESRKSVLADEINSPGSTRMMSLHARLQAMVEQHSMPEPRLGQRSQSYTSELDLLGDARPQRIKDTLRMWDKEMVEAFSPDTPKSPHIALKYYGHHLSAYEKEEIMNFPVVYFLGGHADKHQATPEIADLNFGYDDERGDYKSVVNDHLAYRYEIIKELGRGSFGQVVECFDHKLKAKVAVKLIRNKKRFYAQAKTEVKILNDLIQWDPEDRHHNVKMTDHFYFRSHLCIACECLNMNLYEFIKVNNFQGFHIPLIKRFTVQLLRSLSLLAKHGIIHCDLKPENILLKHPTRSTIKVIDFGSSCLESQRVYTYIQSRFYRSPEIILGLDYTKAIDMWSLGCIIAELYTGIPIFPGENEQEQLACIMEIMGVPSTELIQQSERRHLFFDRRGEPRIVCNSRGKKRRAGSRCLSQVLRCDDPLFLDFIKQCLEWDPTKRLTPDAAFEHEWILQSTKTKDPPSGDIEEQ